MARTPLGTWLSSAQASIQVDQVQPMGLVVTNAEFTAFCTPTFGLNCSLYNPIEVVVSATNVGVVRFVNGEFWGPSAAIADIQGSGTVSFSDCRCVACQTPPVS